MKKRIMITGANGSIGKAILDYLSPNYVVESLDIRTSNPSGKYDTMILCHGGGGKSYDEIFDKNVRSLSVFLRKLPAFLMPNGRIIVFISRRAILNDIREWDYSAAKSASLAYSRMLYHCGINITALCPGWIESKMATENKAKVVISLSEICKIVEMLINSHSRIREIMIESKE